MTRERSIRRAQAIYPYGPGAILDWGQECFIVMDTGGSRSGWLKGRSIRLPRLEQTVDAPLGFKLPPAEVTEWGEPIARLDVQRFPSWLFCPACGDLHRWDRDDEVEKGDGLPTCREGGCRSILVPMRYVAACVEGHISDVDWFRWAHSKQPPSAGPCDRRAARLSFRATAGKGSTLGALVVKCATCNAKRDLSDILIPRALSMTGQRCSGRQPWQSRDDSVDCESSLVVLQRSQTAVHFSEITSALDIRVNADTDTPLSATDEAIAGLPVFERYRPLIGDTGVAPQVRSGMIDDLVQQATAALGPEIEGTEIRRAVERLVSAGVRDGDGSLERISTDVSETDLLRDEWPVLTTPTESRSTTPNIVVRTDGWPAATADGRAFEHYFDGVYLIERLREVRVFRGFHRVSTDGTRVGPDLGRGRRWLPAIEVFGEGIFLELSSDAVNQWLTDNEGPLRRRMGDVAMKIADGARLPARFAALAGCEPAFAMVHTLSHMIMRQLCFECGYSAASIRERLYVLDGHAGILIYTADGDSEGSLGGLVRQGRTDRFPATIMAALERAAWCSNDPICRELTGHGFEKLNSAACHACALVPETSCTHMNALLDRELVIGDGAGGGVRGFLGGWNENGGGGR